MSEQVICCPGGEDSQIGSAVRKRYPQAKICKCESIPEVKESLEKNGGVYVVPVWNSHQGEIDAANFVWDLIEEARIKLSDIWAQRIEFWLVKRSGDTANYGKIGSVIVAQTQCSIFIKQRKAELICRKLTTIAHEEFRNGAEWDGVLVAPGQGENEAGFEVAERQTANANNFTTFVKLASSHEAVVDNTASVWLSGVAMRPLNDYLGDAEQSFFEQMFNSAKALNEIPRLIFAFRRTAKVGLLFEGARLYTGDLLNAEEIESGDISIYEEVGATSRFYTDELCNLFEQEFPALLNHDFVRHDGVKTCLFACPVLGIFTHGYEVETVEPVVRFYINKLFELIDNGADCTPEQTHLFKRHRVAWQEGGSEFMQFKVVGVDP
jgi:prephenate dehydratase